MQANTRLTRQVMGCGYEPPPADARMPVIPWSHAGYRGDPPTTCPGYTASLPDVIEAARARFWKHDLRAFTGGEQPSAALLGAIEVLEAESNNVRDHEWPKDGA